MTEPPSFQKPIFDARIQYYNLLSEILKAGKQAAVLSDLREWYRCLHITYNMVAPYVEPDQQAILRSKLFDVRQRVLDLERKGGSDGSRFHRQVTVDKMLLELDEGIHRAAKRMMLPLESLNNGEFDVKQFMRESDLAQ